MKNKNRLLAVLLACTMVFSMAACGSSDEEASQESSQAVNPLDAFSDLANSNKEVLTFQDVSVDDFVVLGDYKNLALNKPSVEPEQVDYYSNYYYQQLFPEEKGITDRPVQVGDTVNIDYSGRKVDEEEPFQGGTAQGALLTIGSGQFIDGFEDQLIGVMPGETVDLNLTFPEKYHSEELAGQDVIFTVTVHFIIPEEIDLEVIKGFNITGVSTEEEFKSYVKGLLESSMSYDMEELIIEALLTQTTFKDIPEGLKNQKEQRIRVELAAMAQQAGTDAATYVSVNYGMELEEFITYQVEELVKIYSVCQAIADREDLDVSAERLEEVLLEYATSLEYGSVDQFLEEYSNGATREEYREQMMFTNVIEFLTNLENGR